MKNKCKFAMCSLAVTTLLAGTASFCQVALPQAGIINTIVGDGLSGYSGDGTPATGASISADGVIAVDGAGNIYIADSENYRIRKVTAATGLISTVAGNGTPGFSGDGSLATAAGLDMPTGVAVDLLGNLYILSDARVRKVTASSGVISTIVGDGTQGYAGDGGPAVAAEIHATGIAVDVAGNIYIADFFNNRIRKMAVDTGNIRTVAGTGQGGFSGDGGPASGAELYGPYSVAVDALGNLYVAEFFNARIREVTAADGGIQTIAGTGTFGYSGDGGPATSAEIGQPHGVAVDVPGNVYIADDNNNRVREVVVATGNITTVAGDGARGYSGDNGPAIAAELAGVQSVAVDGSGYFYILDNGIRAVGSGTAQAPTSYTVTVKSLDPTPEMGEAVTITANVVSNLGLPAILGSITWFNGSTKLGMSNVDGSGLASFVTTLSVAGDSTISASYAGAVSGFGSTTVPVSGFAFSGPSTPTTIAAGQSAQVTVNTVALHGFANTVDLSCSGLPYPGFCALSTSSVTFTKNMTSQNITATLRTTNSVSTAQSHSGLASSLLCAALCPLFLLGIRRKSAFRMLLIALFVVAGLGVSAGLSGCGSSPTKATTTTPPPFDANVPSGTYTVTLVGKSGNNTVTLPITVTVQ